LRNSATRRLASGLLCATIGACTGDAPDGAADDATSSGEGGWFTDVASSSGVDFVHDAGKTEAKHLPETMGAGAALADLDGDGDLDLYFVQSGVLPGDTRDGAHPTNRLYLNDGRAGFTDATDRSGDAAHAGYGMGVAAGDVDADGDVDLYVTNLGPDLLLLNDGAARFREATTAAGLGDARWTGAATFFDAENDGDLDLYVAGYVQIDLADPIWCGDRLPGHRSYCHPDAYPGLPDRFWRNRGDGTFVEDTRGAGFAPDPDDPGKGLGVLATDFDEDGDLDLYVANDSVENKLWINRGDGTFEDATLISGTGVDEQGRTEAGMGLATGDVDGDLDVDLLVTNFDDESNTLYRNDGGGFFTDATVRAGLEGPSRLPVGFGTVLADLDDDGDLDLAVANGHIIDNIELYHDGKTHAQQAQLFVNDGAGTWSEATPRSGDLGRRPLVGRGLYSGDLDDDGDLDLVLTHCDGPALLLRNDGDPSAAAQGGSVRIEGLPPGTRVFARTSGGARRRVEAANQTSYFGSCAPTAHVGLGAEGLLELELFPPGHAPVTRRFDPPLTRGAVRYVRDRPESPLRILPGAANMPAPDRSPR
jgi:hypothetical protein